MNQRKDFSIKLNVMKLNFFMFLVLFFFSCQEDNYKECADLSYGTDYIQISGVSKSDENYNKDNITKLIDVIYKYALE